MNKERHKCPKDDCEAQCDHAILACRTHWYSLPITTRNEVTGAWRSGDLTRYMDARNAAVAQLNAK